LPDPVDPNAPPVTPPAGDPPAADPKTSVLSDPPAGDPPKDPPAGDDDKKATDDDKKDGDKKDEKDKAAGAPEAYEAFKLPEGVVADQAALDAFVPVAKELNLTQEQAQKLVDLQAAQVARAAADQSKAWADMNDKWVSDAKADKEIGGEKFDENVGVGRKAIEALGTPELRDALAATGAGNHPEFIRFCVRVGKAISEDKIVAAKSGGEKKSAEDRIYNHPTS